MFFYNLDFYDFIHIVFYTKIFTIKTLSYCFGTGYINVKEMMKKFHQKSLFWANSVYPIIDKPHVNK